MRIWTVVDIDSAASARVLEKLGRLQAGVRATVEARPTPVLLYFANQGGLVVDWGGAKSDQVEAVVRDLCGYLSVEVPAIHVEPPEQVPGSYHKLLVHNAGMTATLEAHWGQRLAVGLIADDLVVEERSLYRFVALYTLYTGEDEDRLVVELAAIRIALDAFPPLLRPEFIEGVRPFGGILAGAGISFNARPSGFFRLEADVFIAQEASIALGATLYGRLNELRGEGDVLLCETAEMLPRA